MYQDAKQDQATVTAGHRKLLTAAAIFIVLLVAMGGVLCATQSIRSCPDWPGCFGKILPPMETSPILEITHRFLAALTGLLILAAAITGLLRTRRLRWIMIPPLLTIPLVIAVSYFGAMVVLHGISPEWAAVDLGLALLVVLLLVMTAVIAQVQNQYPGLPVGPRFRSPHARLVLLTSVIIYGVLVSGVLVAGPNSFTSCLGWPIYSSILYKIDSLGVGNIIRQGFSILGIFLILTVVVQARLKYRLQPGIFRAAAWVWGLFLMEMLLQVLVQGFDFNVFLQVAYTVTMAIFWGVWVAFVTRVGLAVDQK
jgi:cytochrome c oxidase assembly protein subunit 15